MEISQEAKRKDALMLVCHQVGQNVLQAAKDRLGSSATSVDGYQAIITKIMGWSGISTEEARNTLKDVEGPYRDEVLHAINRIEESQKKHK